MKQKILFLFLFLFAAQIILPAAVFAETGKNINFNPEVLIPGMEKNASGTAAETIKVDGGGEAIRKYISNFYKFAIGLTGILATIMFAIGGLIWLTSGGSATQVGKAKQLILGSLTGLVLALCSYMILNTINPNIVNLHWGKSIKALDNIGVGCAWVDRDCNKTYEKDSPGFCGADPKAKPTSSAKWHCCCAGSSDEEIIAGNECVKINVASFPIHIDTSLDENHESVCKAECLRKNDKYRSSESIKVKDQGIYEFYSCCLCVKNFEDATNEISCEEDKDCDAISHIDHVDYRCFYKEKVCKPCLWQPDSICHSNNECCKNKCKGDHYMGHNGKCVD